MRNFAYKEQDNLLKYIELVANDLVCNNPHVLIRPVTIWIVMIKNIPIKSYAFSCHLQHIHTFIQYHNFYQQIHLTRKSTSILVNN